MVKKKLDFRENTKKGDQTRYINVSIRFTSTVFVHWKLQLQRSH